MDENKCKVFIRRLKQGGECFSIPGDGILIPIPYDYPSKMPECAELLSRWRVENPGLSPARFPVSNERTEKWLRNSILENDYRVMFMIQNEHRENIGHIGLSGMNFETSTVRIDSVMKGVKKECPGIMARVIEFLKDLCREQLEAQSVDLVVLDDNTRAIRLYEKCDFEVNSSIPLRKIEHDGEINWVEDMSLDKPEKCFLHMECRL